MKLSDCMRLCETARNGRVEARAVGFETQSVNSLFSSGVNRSSFIYVTLHAILVLDAAAPKTAKPERASSGRRASKGEELCV